MFKTFSQKGFQTTFPNGFTVSVMFGAGNYCEHHFNEEVEPGFGATVKVWSEHRSNDAEIAVIDSNGNFVTGFPGCPDCDQVRGWVTPDEMLEVMNWAAAQSKDTISLSEKLKELGGELEKYLERRIH